MYEKVRYQSKLILFELKVNTICYVYVCFQFTYTKTIYELYNDDNIDTNWKNPMIPIETTIRSSVYLILPFLPTHAYV